MHRIEKTQRHSKRIVFWVVDKQIQPWYEGKDQIDFSYPKQAIERHNEYLRIGLVLHFEQKENHKTVRMKR